MFKKRFSVMHLLLIFCAYSVLQLFSLMGLIHYLRLNQEDEPIRESKLQNAKIKPRPDKDTLDPTITEIIQANLFFGLDNKKVIREVEQGLGSQYRPGANFGNNKVVIHLARVKALNTHEMILIGANSTAGLQLDVNPNFGPDSSHYLYEKPILGYTIEVIINIVSPNEEEVIDLILSAVKGTLPQVYDRRWFQYDKKEEKRFERYIEDGPMLMVSKRPVIKTGL